MYIYIFICICKCIIPDITIEKAAFLSASIECARKTGVRQQRRNATTGGSQVRCQNKTEESDLYVYIYRYIVYIEIGICTYIICCCFNKLPNASGEKLNEKPKDERINVHTCIHTYTCIYLYIYTYVCVC